MHLMVQWAKVTQFNLNTGEEVIVQTFSHIKNFLQLLAIAHYLEEEWPVTRCPHFLELNIIQ